VLALGALIKAPTVAKLAQELSSSESQSTSDCLVTLQEGNARLPLFCVHGHSGNILMYRSLANRLQSSQTVYGIQPIGINGKGPAPSCIEDMAAAYVSEIRRVQPQGPYMLAGYCMGGTVAFEMACQLRRSGYDIGLLALFDTYNWIKMTPVSALQMPLLKLQEWWFSWNHFLLMPSEKKIEALTRRARPASLDAITERNGTMALRYTPQTYDGRISHFYTTHKYPRYARPEMEWHGLTTAGVDDFPLRGYPWQLFEEPIVTELAAQLKSCINSVVQQLHP
jgi:thioesterase domain-containing protein